MEKLKVERYEQTCWACPSQWDIFAEGDNYIYARYRWGHLSLTLNDRETIFSEQVRDGLDGVMGTDELMGLTEDVLDWANV